MSRSWSRMLSRLLRKTPVKPVPRRAARLGVEQVEDRVVPATVITILDSGTGTLDGFLSATDGTITAADSAGVDGSVSRAALEGVNPDVDISITAETSVVFAVLAAPIALQTGPGNSASFIANVGSVVYTDSSDSVGTAGGDVNMAAGLDVSIGGITAAGGDVTLAASRDVTISAPIVTTGTGAIAVNANTDGGAGSFSNFPGATLTTDSGDITITSREALTVSDTIRSIAGGDISISIVSSVTVSTLNIDAAVGASGGDGNIIISGVDNIVVADPVSTVGAGTITLDGDNDLLAGGVVTTTGIGTLSTAGGNISITGSDADLGAPIDAGAGEVILNPRIASSVINLGTDANFGITDADLDQIAAVVVRIGSAANTGGIAISNAITRHAGFDTLALSTGNATATAVTQSAPLSVANLAIRSGGRITLIDAANDVDLLATTTGANSLLDYRDANDLAIDLVDGLSGINNNGSADLTIGGALALNRGINTNGFSTAINAVGLISQGFGPESAIVSGLGLIAISTGGAVNLTNTNNDVGFGLAGQSNTSFSFINSGDLAIFGNTATSPAGSVFDASTAGIRTNNAPIFVSTIDGDIVVGPAPFLGDIVAGTSSVTLVAGSAPGTDRLLTVGGNVSGDAGIQLAANNMNIATGFTIDAGPGSVRLDTFDTSTAIDLGGADAPGVLGLADAELDDVVAGVLIIGNTANAANISVTGAISPAGTGQLELETGAASIVDGGGSITVARLGLTADALIGAQALPLNVRVSNLEAVAQTNGININNTGTALTIGGVNGTLNGVQILDNGPIAITNDGGITISETVAIAGGSANLTILTTEGNITIDAPVTNSGSGDVVINAEDDVVVQAPVSAAGTGSIAIVAEPSTGPSALAGNFSSTGLGTLTTENGSISIQAGDGIDIGAAVAAGGAGSITINADAAIDDVGDFTNTAAGTIATQGGNVSITAEDVTLGGTINTTIAAGSRVAFSAQRATEVFNLGSDSDYGLSDAELDLITTGTIQVGDAGNTGGIRVAGQVSLAPASVATLSLVTAGGITDNAGDAVDDIVVTNLVLRAGTGIGVGDALNLAVSNLAAKNSTTGDILVSNNLASASGTLTIATVDGLNGVQSTAPDGNIEIASNGPVVIDGVVNTSGGGDNDVLIQTVGAVGGISNTAKGIVQSNNGTGDVLLDSSIAGSIVLVDSNVGTEVTADSTGNVTLLANDAVTIGSNVAVDTDAGDITVRSNVNDLNGIDHITLALGASIRTEGDIELNADPDGNWIGGAVNLASGTQLSGSSSLAAQNILLRAGSFDVTVDVLTADEDITILTSNNIVDDGVDSTVIAAGDDIFLTAGGRIGGSTPLTPADILSASTAAPAAAYRAALDVSYGDELVLDQVGSLGNIQIRKVGAGIALSEIVGINGVVDVVGAGNQLALISAGGTFVVDTVFTLNGANNADLFLATVAGNDIAFNPATNAVNNGATATTTLIASGTTTAAINAPVADGTANLTGTNVLLATSGGNIGSAANPVEINANATSGRFDGFTNGTVNGVASAGGNAFITDTQNGIRVGLFNAGTTGDVTLNSLGNITPTGSSIVAVTHNDNVAEIIGDAIGLNVTATSTGTGGQIGLPATFFEVSSNTLGISTTNSNYWVSEVGTGAAAGTAIALATVGTTAGTTTGFLRVRNGGTITSAFVDGAADVIAPVVNLSNVAGDTPAGGGFGVSTANALEIDAATLNSNLANGGSEFVRDIAGGLVVQRANTTAGDVGIESVGGNLVLGNGASTGSVVLATGGTATLNAAGSITNAAGAGVVDVTATSLALIAGGSAGSLGGAIVTNVDTLAASADADVVVSNSGDLEIATVSGVAGVASANSSVDIETTGAITVTDQVLASNDVTLVATDDAAAGQDVTLDALVNGDGSVLIQAGDNLTVNATGSVSSLGPVSLVGDAGDADAGAGVAINVLGPVTSGTPAAVSAGPDSDTITIDVSVSNNAFDVNGGNPVFPTFKGDTLNLTLTGVTTPVITPTGIGAGTYTFGNRPDVDFDSIENLVPGQTISGTAYLDANRNGVRDANELPLANTTVHLDRGNDGTDDAFTFTDANGEYSFPDNTPGDFAIRFDGNSQFVQTTPNPTVIGFSDATDGIDFGTYGRGVEVIGSTKGQVQLRDAETGTLIQTLTPFPGFFGEVNVASGDFDGDGYLDIFSSAGSGGGPHVRVISGKDFTELTQFFAYSASFTGGVFIAAGDVDGDGRADVITGAGDFGGPHVKVFHGTGGGAVQEIASFFAYTPSVYSGVHVGAGDVDGDGLADIITGTRNGSGFAPHVKVFSGANGAEIRSFFAYDVSYTNGVFVAGADLDGDGQAEIITGTAGVAPHVKVFNGASGAEQASFFAYDPSVPGVRVGATDHDNDGDFDIVTGSTIGRHVKVFDGVSLAELDSFLAFDDSFSGGVYVGGA